MTSVTANRYTLDYGGKRYAVETHSAGFGTSGRLFVDDRQVDEQKSKNHRVHLEGGGLSVVVFLNWLDQITHILAVPSGTDPQRAEVEGMAFAPPPASRAEKLEELKRNHPALYAARHIAIAVAQTLAGALGIGALLWGLFVGLLPRISVPLPDLPAIPWPDVDLPDIPWPGIPWPDIPLPAVDLPDLAVFGWIKEIWSSASWLIPIIIAVFVAINEVDKRRKRERAERERG